ncbi:uncharacterized protein RHO17_008673 [Thomomys bottae]
MVVVKFVSWKVLVFVTPTGSSKLFISLLLFFSPHLSTSQTADTLHLILSKPQPWATLGVGPRRVWNHTCHSLLSTPLSGVVGSPTPLAVETGNFLLHRPPPPPFSAPQSVRTLWELGGSEHSPGSAASPRSPEDFNLHTCWPPRRPRAPRARRPGKSERSRLSGPLPRCTGRPPRQPPHFGPPSPGRSPEAPDLPQCSSGGALRRPSALRRCAHPLGGGSADAGSPVSLPAPRAQDTCGPGLTLAAVLRRPRAAGPRRLRTTFEGPSPPPRPSFCPPVRAPGKRGGPRSRDDIGAQTADGGAPRQSM